MFRLITAGVFLFVCSHAALAEFYARDEKTIIELQYDDKGQLASYELTAYGAPAEGAILYGYGQFKPDGGGRFTAVSTGGSRLTMEEKKEDSVEVSSKGLEIAIGPRNGEKFDASGTYKRLPEDQRLAWAKARFKSTDDLLNTTYKRVIASSPDRAKSLRDSQRDWIKYRDDMAGFGLEDPVEKSPSYWNQRTEHTVTRIEFLQAWAGEFKVNSNPAGTYRDFHGGHLTVLPGKKKFEFQMEVVRGPSSHLGNIEGEARWLDKKIAEFRDESDPPAVIRFTFEERGIVKVEGENTSEYHGARAYFDGTYYKVSDEAEIRHEDQ